MTSIINNFEITSGLTITDGNLQVKTNSTNTSLDVSGNITIGSDDTVEGNTKLILKNVADSTIELYSNFISSPKKNAIINKAGILQFTTQKNAGCLYEFELGDGNTSVGFMNSSGNNKPGIVFGRKVGADSLSVNDYSNAQIFYSTVDNALNFTGEKIIFNTSTGNYGTLAQSMIIDISGRIGMFTSTPKVSLDVVGTDAIRIPSGTTLERPTDASGCIRYNTTTSSYEGFGPGSVWETLGGVRDVDRDTYISAETTPGTDNDQLKFYTAGVERMIIDQSGNVDISDNLTVGGIITGDLSGNATTVTNGVYTSGDQTITGMKHFTKNGTGNIAKFSRTGAMDLVIDGDNGNCNFLVKSTTGINIAVDSSLPQYNSTKGIFIKNDGNVGIGTISPKAKLNVAGKITTTDNTIPINYGGNVTTT